MKTHLLNLIKFINVFIGFSTCLYLISKSIGLFALLLAIFITYLNIIIDELLKRANQEGC